MNENHGNWFFRFRVLVCRIMLRWYFISSMKIWKELCTKHVEHRAYHTLVGLIWELDRRQKRNLEILFLGGPMYPLCLKKSNKYHHYVMFNPIEKNNTLQNRQFWVVGGRRQIWNTKLCKERAACPSGGGWPLSAIFERRVQWKDESKIPVILAMN